MSGECVAYRALLRWNPALTSLARGIAPVVTLQHLSLPAWVLTPPSRTRWPGPLPFASGRGPGFEGSLRGWESTETVDAFAAHVTRVAPALRDASVHEKTSITKATWIQPEKIQTLGPYNACAEFAGRL